MVDQVVILASTGSGLLGDRLVALAIVFAGSVFHNISLHAVAPKTRVSVGRMWA